MVVKPSVGATVTLPWPFLASVAAINPVVFISSTNRSVLAVGEVNGRKMPHAPGDVTKKLDAAIDRYIADYVAARATPAGR